MPPLENQESNAAGSSLIRKALLGATVVALPAGAGLLVGADTLSQNLGLTVLLLVIYELVVFALAFSGSVIAVLKERWVGRLVEIVDQLTVARMRSYKRRYLTFIRDDNDYIDLHGLSTRGEYTLALNEAFIKTAIEPTSPIDFDVNPVRQRESVTSDRTYLQQEAGESIWYWLNRDRAPNRRSTQSPGTLRSAFRKDRTLTSRSMPNRGALALVGPPGSGKTTLLRHTAEVLASGRKTRKAYKAPKALPIMLTLRSMAPLLSVNPLPLPEMICEAIETLPAGIPSTWFERCLRTGNSVVLLDGLDELATPRLRSAATQWLNQQQLQYPKAIFVITSRPFGYRENPIGNVTILRTLPFTSQQIEEYISRWYEVISERRFGSLTGSARLVASKSSRQLIGRILENPVLRELASNPLLLTMMANVHNYRGALPGTRAELYNEVCAVFLGRRHQARGIELDIQTNQKQAILQKLAYEMMRSKATDATIEGADYHLKATIARIAPGFDTARILGRIEESSGIVIEREIGKWAFAHLTFQEYLASVHIREHGLVSELAATVQDDWWHETARLYCAESDATPIVRACLELEDDVSALTLALECMQDARELSPEVRTLVANRSNPRDLKLNASARRLAATLSLSVKSNDVRALSDDVAIFRDPVNRLEFQAFLDGSSFECPRSWTSDVYLDDTEALPITGVSRSTAVEFSRWTTNVLKGRWSYRLPNLSELTAAAAPSGDDRTAHLLNTLSYVWAVQDGSSRAVAVSPGKLQPLKGTAAIPVIGRRARDDLMRLYNDFVRPNAVDSDFSPLQRQSYGRKLADALTYTAAAVSRMEVQIAVDPLALNSLNRFVSTFPNDTEDAKGLLDEVLLGAPRTRELFSTSARHRRRLETLTNEIERRTFLADRRPVSRAKSPDPGDLERYLGRISLVAYAEEMRRLHKTYLGGTRSKPRARRASPDALTHLGRQIDACEVLFWTLIQFELDRTEEPFWQCSILLIRERLRELG